MDAGARTKCLAICIKLSATSCVSTGETPNRQEHTIGNRTFDRKEAEDQRAGSAKA